MPTKSVYQNGTFVDGVLLVCPHSYIDSWSASDFSLNYQYKVKSLTIRCKELLKNENNSIIVDYHVNCYRDISGKKGIVGEFSEISK